MPPPWPPIAPRHCLPSPEDIEFELALFATTYGKRKTAEQLIERERMQLKNIRVVNDDQLCQYEVAAGKPCWNVKPCCAAHGGPGLQCASVLEFEPEKRCIINAMDGARYCSIHAPAPNLGPLMHQAFLDREDEPTAEELVQFAREHFPDSDHAEVQNRVEMFCARVRDGKRRRTQ